MGSEPYGWESNLAESNCSLPPGYIFCRLIA